MAKCLKMSAKYLVKYFYIKCAEYSVGTETGENNIGELYKSVVCIKQFDKQF